MSLPSSMADFVPCGRLLQAVAKGLLTCILAPWFVHSQSFFVPLGQVKPMKKCLAFLTLLC